MKKTAAKNIKLVLVFTVMMAVFAAAYFGISRHHFNDAAASVKQDDKTSCTENRLEETTPTQFVAFRIMQLL